MAIMKCNECGKEMSTSARACPHCGARRPGLFGRIIRGTVVIIFGLTVLSCVANLALNSSDPVNARPSSVNPAAAAKAGATAVASQTAATAAATPALPELRVYRTTEESKAAKREEEKRKAAKVNAALAGLAKKVDKMRDVAWYQHKTSPKYRNQRGFYVYFGRDTDGTVNAPRFVMQYTPDDWLFIERAWAKVDGVQVALPQKSGLLGWERDHQDGDIFEWSDVSVDSSDLEVLRRIAAAKSVTVRFEGKQYRSDRTLTVQELKAMREVLAAWDAANG